MSHRKSSVPLMQSGGTPLSIHKSLKMRTTNRSEFDDHLLRHNQREENRLALELEQWDKAQRIVTKGMDKDTLWFRQKTQISGNGTATSSSSSRPSAKRHSFSYGTVGAGGEGYDGQGTRLIPDYQVASRLYQEPTTTATAATATSSSGKPPPSPRRSESESNGPAHDGIGENSEGSSGSVGRKPSSPQGAVATSATASVQAPLVNSYGTHSSSSSSQTDRKTRESPSQKNSDTSQPGPETNRRRRSETRKEAPPRDAKDRSRRPGGKDLRREEEGDKEEERRRRKRRENNEALDGPSGAGTEHEAARSQSKGALYLSVSPSSLSARKPSPQESQGSSRESENGRKEVGQAKRAASPKTSDGKKKSPTEARSEEPAKRGLPDARSQNTAAGKSHPQPEAFPAPLSMGKPPSTTKSELAPGASQHPVAAAPSPPGRPNAAAGAAAQAQAAASLGFNLPDVGDDVPTTFSLEMSWDGRRRYANVWDTLSTPRQKSTVRAVRERLKQEFSSPPAGLQPASRRTTPASKTPSAALAKLRH